MGKISDVELADDRLIGIVPEGSFRMASILSFHFLVGDIDILTRFEPDNNKSDAFHGIRFDIIDFTYGRDGRPSIGLMICDSTSRGLAPAYTI